MPSDARTGLIRFLRPREISYVSLESKLSEAGAISQVPTVLSCMTTGSPGRFDTPWGAIEFTHTDRDIALGTEVHMRDDGLLEATVERSARDLRRVGRNVGLIDPETQPRQSLKREIMNGRANSIKSAIADFMVRSGIPGEMEQNLIKEVIHLHLLSALSEAGVLRHVVFQGGTALRLCYGGERYSEDLDFVCGKAGSYVEKIEFDRLVDNALQTTKRSLQREFDIKPDEVTLKQPPFPMAIKGNSTAVAAWQIAVPIAPIKHLPKSRIKIEFANVPSYDSQANVAKAIPAWSKWRTLFLPLKALTKF